MLPKDRNSAGIYKENANGYQKALYHSNVFAHILIIDPDESVSDRDHMEDITGTLNATNSVVRDVRVDRSRGSGRGGRSFELAARRRNHPAWDTPQVQVFEDISDGPTHYLVEVTVEQDDPAGMDVFIRNSSFDNSSDRLFSGSGGGRIEDLKGGGDPSKLRVFMEDVTFNMSDRNFVNAELFFAMARFRNVTDRRSGHTSETRQTLRASDFDGLEAVVPLDLFWAPLDRDFVTFSGTGGSAMESWEITDADGDALGGDKRQPYVRITLSEPLGSRTLTVDAAVRPWEDGVEVPDLDL